MSIKTHIFGIGQGAAGDDGVGLAIVRALNDENLPDSVVVHELKDPLRLIDYLDGDDQVIIVDAVVNNEGPGHIKILTSDDLAEENLSTLSSHGTNISQVFELAGTLISTKIKSNIRIVGVTISRPTHYTYQMSPMVKAAIPRAISRIREMVGN